MTLRFARWRDPGRRTSIPFVERADRNAEPAKTEWQLDSVHGRNLERMWDQRADSWEHHGSAGLGQVVDAVLAAAGAEPGTTTVDLGCGTGELALPLAQKGAHVTAVDISSAMVRRLEEKAADAQLDTIVGVVSSMEAFQLPPESIDLVVSNYALHHLRDRDKEVLVRSAARWLRPGGRMVVGDMMFGRGATARDRAIITSKIAVLARRGPAGWWRLAKNVGRFTFRLQERPVTMETWRQWFEDAGFEDVSTLPVVSEAAVIVGTKPL
jgi:ubiquinone/menaquinone biosynthesis C-methylase UbiE